MTKSPTALYANSLKPFETQWVSCCPVKKLSLHKLYKTSHTVTPFIEKGPGLYSFVLLIEGKRYFYEFTGRYTFHSLPSKPERRVILKSPVKKLPEDQTHLYLEETMKVLSLYRENLNQFTMVDLDERLENIQKPRQFPDWAPSLFHLNLLQRVQQNAALQLNPINTPPPLSPLEEGKTCLIKPVYGPSHNPLRIEWSPDSILTVEFRQGNVPTIIQDNERIQIDLKKYEEGSSQSIPLIILSMVDRISHLPSLKKADVLRLLKDEFVTKPRLNKRQMTQLSYKRIAPLSMDVFFASQLINTIHKKDLANEKSTVEENAKEAIDLLKMIHNEYRTILESEEKVKEKTIETLKNMIHDYQDLL